MQGRVQAGALLACAVRALCARAHARCWTCVSAWLACGNARGARGAAAGPARALRCSSLAAPPRLRPRAQAAAMDRMARDTDEGQESMADLLVPTTPATAAGAAGAACAEAVLVALAAQVVHNGPQARKVRGACSAMLTLPARAWFSPTQRFDCGPASHCRRSWRPPSSAWTRMVQGARGPLGAAWAMGAAASAAALHAIWHHIQVGHAAMRRYLGPTELLCACSSLQENLTDAEVHSAQPHAMAVRLWLCPALLACQHAQPACPPTHPPHAGARAARVPAPLC